MKKAVLLLAVITVLTLPSFAQIEVTDPASYAQLVKEVESLQQQLQQLQQSYKLAVTNYNLAVSQAKNLNMSNYKYTFNSWQNLSSSSTYGNTGTFVSGLNSGSATQIQSGYRQLVPTVTASAPPKNPEKAAQWKQQYGLLETQDATTLASSKTVGDVNTNVSNNASALLKLESDSFSTAADISGAVAVLQKINIALLMQLRQTQDTNRLLVALTQLQLQDAMQKRYELGAEMQTSANVRTGTN